MMIFFRSLLIIGCALVFTACATTTVRHSKDYNSSLKSGSNLVIFPPEAKVYETDVSGGSKRLYDFEYNIEDIIAEQIIHILADKGYRAKLLTRKEIYDQKLNELVDRVENRVTEIETKLYKQEAIEEKIAFSINETIGGAANDLANKDNVELIVSVSYARKIKSSGSQTLGVVAAAFGVRSEPADTAGLRVAIIEAKTGKILWTNRLFYIHSVYFSSDNKEKETKIMKEFLEKLLKPLNN